jgi:hypothetical protein
MNQKIKLIYFLFLFLIPILLLIPPSYSLTIKENIPLKELGASPIIIEDSIDICKNYDYEITFSIPQEYPPEVDKICINNISIKTIGIKDGIFLYKIHITINNMQITEFYNYNLKLKRGEIFRSFDKSCRTVRYKEGTMLWIVSYDPPVIFNWYEFYLPICFDKNVLKSGENKLKISLYPIYNYDECVVCASLEGDLLIKEAPLIISFENATIFMYRPKLEAKIVLSNKTTGANVPIKVDAIIENKRDITAYDISLIFDTPGASIVQGNSRISFEKLEYERSQIGSILIKYLKEGNYTLKISLSWKDQAGNTYKTTLSSDQITILPPKLNVKVIPQGSVGDSKAFIIEVRDFYSFSTIQDASIRVVTEAGSETLYTDSEGKAIFRTSAKGKAQLEVNAKGYPVELVSFDLGLTKPFESNKSEENNLLIIVVIIILAVVAIVLLFVIFKGRKKQNQETKYIQYPQFPSYQPQQSFIF